MKIQSSFERDEAKLYVVPTPIGNLEDITFRALAILKEVDLIAAEDTRNTMNLLRHFEIDNHLVSYHEHNERERTKQLLDYLAEGKSDRRFERDEAKLYVVPTPIGNLEDRTFRALAILKEVDLIAAEDTRNTMNLLRHFEIDNHLVSYHEHNERERTKQLLDYLAEGKSIALVSDAGMPAISDPGHVLVQAVIERNYDVVVLPGANAALTALVGSGLSTERFLFYGFLPRKTRE